MTLAVLLAPGLSACDADGSDPPTSSVASESPTVAPDGTAPTASAPPTAGPTTEGATVPTGTPDTGTAGSGSATADDTAPPTSDPTPTTDPVAGQRLALQAARDRWRVAAIRSYEYEYTARCDCTGPDVTVRVLGDRPIVPLMTAAYDGHGVQEWFDAIDEAIETERLLDASYDDEDGFPVSITMEQDEDVADGFTPYGIEDAHLRAVDDPVARWFTESWGCGRRLVAATPDQTAAVVLEFDDTLPGGYAAGTRDVTRLESAELWFGSDLFAGWCRDVVDTTAPTAQLLDTWAIDRGTVDLEARLSATTATALATGLVASDHDGRSVPLGDAEFVNEEWGTLPG